MTSFDGTITMTDSAPNFAIIPVPYGTPSPNSAIMQGPLRMVMEHVLGSRARADAEALVKRAADAAEEEREREQQEQQAISEGVRALRDGILKLSHRVDALVRSRDARRKLDHASEATRKMLELPKDAPPLDLTDDMPQPSGELRPQQAKDPAEHQSVFVPFEQKILAATKEAGKRNDSAAPGQLRMVEEINPQNGSKMIKWLGTRSFIHDFKSPIRFVRSFWSEQGPMTTSRGYLR
jgi:hypothetical protein